MSDTPPPIKLPQGYPINGVPKDYTGEVYLESQMHAHADRVARTQPVQPAVGLKNLAVNDASNRFITAYVSTEDAYKQPIDAMDAAFKAGAEWAQPVQPATPDGMCLVPIEATPQMIAAGEVYTHTYYSEQDDLLQAYRAMIAAHNTSPHTALPAEPASRDDLTDAQIINIAIDAGVNMRTGRGALRLARAIISADRAQPERSKETQWIKK